MSRAIIADNFRLGAGSRIHAHRRLKLSANMCLFRKCTSKCVRVQNPVTLFVFTNAQIHDQCLWTVINNRHVDNYKSIGPIGFTNRLGVKTFTSHVCESATHFSKLVGFTPRFRCCPSHFFKQRNRQPPLDEVLSNFRIYRSIGLERIGTLCCVGLLQYRTVANATQRVKCSDEYNRSHRTILHQPLNHQWRHRRKRLTNQVSGNRQLDRSVMPVKQLAATANRKAFLDFCVVSILLSFLVGLIYCRFHFWLNAALPSPANFANPAFICVYGILGCLFALSWITGICVIWMFVALWKSFD